MARGIIQANLATKFIATFTKGSFAGTLSTSSALTDDDLKAVSRPVVITVIFNNMVVQKTQNMSFTAKKGKTGAAKWVK